MLKEFWFKVGSLSGFTGCFRIVLRIRKQFFCQDNVLRRDTAISKQLEDGYAVEELKDFLRAFVT